MKIKSIYREKNMNIQTIAVIKYKKYTFLLSIKIYVTCKKNS